MPSLPCAMAVVATRHSQGFLAPLEQPPIPEHSTVHNSSHGAAGEVAVDCWHLLPLCSPTHLPRGGGQHHWVPLNSTSRPWASSAGRASRAGLRAGSRGSPVHSPGTAARLPRPPSLLKLLRKPLVRTGPAGACVLGETAALGCGTAWGHRAAPQSPAPALALLCLQHRRLGRATAPT